MNQKCAVILSLFLVFCSKAKAQDPVSEFKRFKVFPLPAIGYTPETRWYIGAVALFSLRLDDDSLSRPSSFKAEFNITQNEQWIAYLNFDLRPDHEKYILSGSNGYFKFPEDYWGIGTDTPDSNKVNYNANRLELDNSLLIKAHTGLYAGLRYRYHYMLVKNFDPGLYTQTVSDIKYETGGVGFALLFDTRDNTFTPKLGYYFNTSVLFFNRIFGGSYTFEQVNADLRTYFPLHKNGVLAFQINSSFNFGSSPFRMLPLIGNESNMRGYYTGRYRDDYLISSQLEYRASIWRWIGIAAFAGGGSVFNSNTTELTILPNYGMGLRIRVDKKDKINLRFDYGMGKNTDGFYVAFAEAF